MHTRRRFFGLFPALAGAALVAKAEPTTHMTQMAMIEGSAAPLRPIEGAALLPMQAVEGASSACPHLEMAATNYGVPQLFELIRIDTTHTEEKVLIGHSEGLERRGVEICLNCGALFSQALKNEIVNQKKD